MSGAIARAISWLGCSCALGCGVPCGDPLPEAQGGTEAQRALVDTRTGLWEQALLPERWCVSKIRLDAEPPAALKQEAVGSYRVPGGVIWLDADLQDSILLDTLDHEVCHGAVFGAGNDVETAKTLYAEPAVDEGRREWSERAVAYCERGHDDLRWLAASQASCADSGIAARASWMGQAFEDRGDPAVARAWDWQRWEPPEGLRLLPIFPRASPDKGVVLLQLTDAADEAFVRRFDLRTAELLPLDDAAPDYFNAPHDVPPELRGRMPPGWSASSGVPLEDGDALYVASTFLETVGMVRALVELDPQGRTAVHQEPCLSDADAATVVHFPANQVWVLRLVDGGLVWARW